VTASAVTFFCAPGTAHALEDGAAGRKFEASLASHYTDRLAHTDGFMRTSSYRAVFLSPHLDDAVFSCAGTIAKLASEGPVLVLNVFSGYTAEVRRGPVVIDQARHAEEASASAFLGFASDCLNETDAALRDRAYQHPANLFRPPIRRDVQRLPALSSRIHDYLAGIRYEALYLPLGIGWHVDHILCHLATQSMHKHAGVLFYEDAPYCFVPNFTDYRLLEIAVINGSDAGPEPGSERFAGEWYDASRYYAGMAPIRKMRPWAVRAGAIAVVSIYLWRLLSYHRRLRHSDRGGHGQRLEPKVHDIAAHFSRKIDACYRYGSQVQEFFTDRRDCESRYREYSAMISARTKNIAAERSVCERFWEFEALPTGSER
jgi:LmbE family N-acetylglucosaminyl deacetylase